MERGQKNLLEYAILFKIWSSLSYFSGAFLKCFPHFSPLPCCGSTLMVMWLTLSGRAGCNTHTLWNLRRSRKLSKTKTVITQKPYKIEKTCKYKIYRSKSCDSFKIGMKSVAQTMLTQWKHKQVWVRLLSPLDCMREKAPLCHSA